MLTPTKRPRFRGSIAVTPDHSPAFRIGSRPTARNPARVDSAPFFDVPLNLPHAGRIARRLVTYLHRDGRGNTTAAATATELVELLAPYYDSDENPHRRIAEEVRAEAAQLGRRFVDQVELDALGHDLLGQAVRNLFECLELGREGAAISLRAGEDPDSMQRPR